jgi:leucyl aminopeptidase
MLDTHSSPAKKVDYVLIGKGVMFDTGGLNIKADDDLLYQEKTDMAGAAIIACFMLGYSKLDVKSKRCRIVGLLPLSQNDIGARGTHSGDVLTAYNGKSVEIVDTDAEGRLLLADALSYANKHYKGAIVIDMATLTGDQAYMSCKTFSSAISRHPEVVKRLIDAGNIIQERIVESPFLEEFRDYLNSPIADIKNIGDNKCKSDTILGGVFLGQFIDPDVRWIHLDIAGTAYGMDEMKAYYPPEGSAIGVRLLFEFIGNHGNHISISKHTISKKTKKISRK